MANRGNYTGSISINKVHVTVSGDLEMCSTNTVFVELSDSPYSRLTTILPDFVINET